MICWKTSEIIVRRRKVIFCIPSTHSIEEVFKIIASIQEHEGLRLQVVA
jgi:predicted DNA-binding protein (UPF0251 family)